MRPARSVAVVLRRPTSGTAVPYLPPAVPSSARARHIERRLKAVARPDRAKILQRFFKTGPGEYGEGDRFLGVRVPELRRLARKFRDTPIREIELLLDSPWHEVRLLAVMLLADAYRAADDRGRDRIYRLCLRRSTSINNWDLVDVTAPAVIGGHLEKRSRRVLQRLARSTIVWERRMAIVSTQHFIRLGQFEDTLALSVLLLRDEHDLIHKATGWMLREVGKRDEQTLRRFLDRHAASMPRTALRYAIERLPSRDRARYLAVPRHPASQRHRAS